MFAANTVFTLIIIYLLLMIWVANWAQKLPSTSALVNSPWLYSLTLAVYCTSWTFYGSVGMAANQGILFLSIYLGPTLALIFGQQIIRKMVRLKSQYHITSIADLISARYNKSQCIAALVTIICLIGVMPYIALQLKAVSSSFILLVSNESQEDIWQIEILFVVMMIFFTILFGVRKLDPTERHQGMMIVLAAESIVKLIAFIAVGIFVTFSLFDGFDDLFSRADQASATITQSLSSLPPLSSWATMILLAMMAFVLLPRQFHIMVVENTREHNIRTAQWALPGYLLLMNIFVIPIAAAGLLLGHPAEHADIFVLLLPLQADQNALSLLVFFGGLSAATGMILISAMSLSTMVTNHLIMPVLEAVPNLQPLRQYVLPWRWMAVAFSLFVGFLFNQNFGSSYMLVNMGLISFAAVSQFAPSIIGGLYWEKGNTRAALYSLAIGFSFWAFTLILPAFIKSGWLDTSILTEGLFGITLLKPEQFLGVSVFNPLTHAMFWSLGLNSLSYLLFSNLFASSEDEKINASEFVDILQVQQAMTTQQVDQPEIIALEQKQSQLILCFTDYMSGNRARVIVERCVKKLNLQQNQQISLIQLAYLQREAESTLAGIVGGAIAHQAILRSELFNDQEQQTLSNTYSELLSKIHLTPEELSEKIDFHIEREKLISDHADRQHHSILQLQEEVEIRLEAERSLRELNEKLETLVEQRTGELLNSNQELQGAMTELRRAQKQLIESKKMAYLGGLVSGVAHEMNTPLGVSVTAISYLIEEMELIQQRFEQKSLTHNDLETFHKDALSGLNLLKTNIDNLTVLINDFKMVSVTQSITSKYLVNVYQLITETIETLKPKIDLMNIQVSIVGSNQIEINTYPEAIQQVLINLTSNAMQHAFVNDHPNPKIDIRFQFESEILTLIYKDNGIGMPSGERQKIFDPFYTTIRGLGGSGLGAHIVFNLVVHRLNGKITCQSNNAQPDSGTTFEIQIPHLNVDENSTLNLKT